MRSSSGGPKAQVVRDARAPGWAGVAAASPGQQSHARSGFAIGRTSNNNNSGSGSNPRRRAAAPFSSSSPSSSSSSSRCCLSRRRAVFAFLVGFCALFSVVAYVQWCALNHYHPPGEATKHFSPKGWLPGWLSGSKWGLYYRMSGDIEKLNRPKPDTAGAGAFGCQLDALPDLPRLRDPLTGRKKFGSDRDAVTLLLWHGAGEWAGLGANGNEDKDRQLPGWGARGAFLGRDDPRDEADSKGLHKCPVECNVIEAHGENREREGELLGRADAVVIEPSSGAGSADAMWSWVREPVRLPQKRPGQLWARFGYESPDQYPLLGEDRIARQFDINMTYDHARVHGNVPVSMFCDFGATQGNILADLKRDPQYSSRTGFAAVVFDDCGRGKGAKERYAFTRDLMDRLNGMGLPVDSFGSCLPNQKWPTEAQAKAHLKRGENFGAFQAELTKLFTGYKFVLAFETSDETDLVSPVVLAALRAGAVPVFRGTSEISSWVPDAAGIVEVGKRTAAEMAAELQASEKKLAAFGKWRKQTERTWNPAFFEKLDHCVATHPECRLCQAVHEYQRRLPDTTLDHAGSIRDRSFALDLDGRGMHAHAPTYDGANLGEKSGQFTLGAWIFLRAISDYRIIDKNSPGSQSAWGMDVIGISPEKDRGFLRICGMGGCHQGLKPLSLNVWYHVAITFVTYDSAQAHGIPYDGAITYYINGKRDYQTSYIHMFHQPPLRNQLDVVIGKSAGADTAHFRGVIDDVSMWDYAMPEAAIQRLMYQRLGGLEPGLISYWSFDEGEGLTVRDATGQGNMKIEAGQTNPWTLMEEKPLSLGCCA